ncbi:PR domain zinc finger protein 14-like [Actinia tenebrosa]|uniref:PR domain zinc finger protein 14-like n=1 Tax=Actinia tenebrosa TaxID=6105 RepID=A0A6P8HFI4_ACTTE|nr:PR domain zinc finger protein 14-like [Actinia tenebrosa]
MANTAAYDSRAVDTSLPLFNDNTVPGGIQVLTKECNDGIAMTGVFCTHSMIPRGTRFGPFTGKVVFPQDVIRGQDNPHMWEVYSSEDAISYFIDGSEESRNWMKFVNSAISEVEQNMSVVQQGREIYYEATKNIYKGDELMVWYGRNYEMFMGVPMALRKEGMEPNKTTLEQTDCGFSCQQCGKVFAYQYYRDKHLKYTRCIDNGDRKFPCSLCDRSFEKRDRLRIHVLHVHQKYRPHQCNVCTKRFSQSSSLNKHMRVHSGERPYKCPFCEKAFTASSILRTHIRQHSGEKPFKCGHCGKAFASHAAHDSHVRRTHTKEKPCVCQYCGKAFAQSYELKFHINMHTGAKPYTCEKCGRGFSSPSSRDRHRVHFDCTTRKNRAPKTMKKQHLVTSETTT